MTQLYEENFGNALGTALGNGVQVFQQRQDQLDQKNYDRAQAGVLSKKQDAQTLYNHLKDMSNSFRDMQAKGGQQGMSSLEISQAGDSLNKANKIMGMLTSGKYDEAQQAFGDFQKHMDAVAGPGPTDSSGAAVSGPAAPVAGTGTYSSADILNNQIGTGNQLLGGLAYKTTDAQATQAVNAAGLSTEQLTQVKATSKSTIEALNATNGVQVATAKIFTDLADFNSTAQKATYLKSISDSGAAGAALVEGLNISPELKAAVQKQAGNVQTRDDASATSATLNNQLATFNLTDLQTKAPYIYTSLLLGNLGMMKDNDIKDADLAKMGTDLERATAELANYKLDAPLQHSLLQQQLDTGKVTLGVLQATQRGEIDGTNARNFGEMAKKGNVSPEYWDNLGKEINPATGKPWLTPALVTSYKKLTELGASTSTAELQILQANATKSGSDARTTVATEGFTVANARNAASLSGSQASMAATDTQFRARADALGVQGQRLDNQGKATANFTSGVQAKYADQMAQTGLKGAQGQATQQQAAGQVAAATVGTEIASAKSKLQGTLLDNTGKALTNDLVRATFGAQVKKYSLDNALTSSNIASNYFQIARSKALLPGEIAAQAAALDYNKAQTTGLLRAASDKGDRAEQTKILQQQRIISDGDLKDAQLGIARLIPNAKFGVDQFDPSNYSTMTAKLDENQKKQLVDAVQQYNDVMKTRKGITSQLSDLLTGNSSLPGGVTTTGTGGNRAMTAPPGFKAQSDSAAKKAGINPAVFYGFLGAESSFGTNLSNYAGMDYVGAGQVGQAAQDDVNRNFKTNLDRNVPEQNMELAARYYKLISTRLKTQDPMVIYAAYNWGAGNVQKHLAANGGKLTLDGLPAETQTGLGNMGAALRGYGSDKGGETPAGTAQNASQTTPPPVPAPLQKGQFKSPGGGVYSSPILQLTQWDSLSKMGFFQEVKKTDAAGGNMAALIDKYAMKIYGKASDAQHNDLVQVINQIIGGK